MKVFFNFYYFINLFIEVILNIKKYLKMKDLYNTLINLQATDYQVDSRLIKKNSLFFAIKGEKVDGHSFLKEIISKKALGIVISKNYNLDISYPSDFNIFRVDNVLEVLQGLAAHVLKEYKTKNIGITGSFGKTITKEFLYTLMGNLKVSKTYKNYNSQIGFPISILNIDKNKDYLILEMAMDKKNEIKKLVDIALLDVVLITSITNYNQQDFKSSTEVAEAKSEIFNGNSINIINHALLKYDILKNKKDFTYSIYNEKADFYFDIKKGILRDFENNRVSINFPFQETHLIENAIASISILKILKIDYSIFLENIKNLKTNNMRFEKVILNDITFIKDCYNAGVDTMIKAIENMNTKNRKISVLGAMCDFKENSKKMHEIVAEVALKNVDVALFLGEEWKHIKNIKVFDDHKSIANHLKEILNKEDMVLVKGSRFFEMEKIFDFI
ncbi:MAG: UDP-N-acetylmuramoyl-tripeptide--D-alanyl-D-alanine ligase [Candidatus Anoxychlamydiales bacterium]|nr:UDP-N-acetylmuramoyl-tripeptide--D-alanyl-D-alanine ligase [Candidatus Anoxychlamydiales bacterium]